MDDFREWLSDNLRYFMLGGAILFVLLLLVFGARACIKSRKNKTDQETHTEQTTPTDEKTETKDSTKEDAVPEMEKANADVTAVIEKYYKALGEKDVDQLSQLVDSLSTTDAASITQASDYIERYEVKDVYVKPGMDDKSNVVYAAYHYYCKDIATAVPALSQFYVTMDDAKNYKIDGNAQKDPTIKAYLDSMLKEADVKALTANIRKEYEDAQERDPALKAFLKELGDEADTEKSSEAASQAAEGAMMEALDECNLRESPDGEIIDVVPAGEQVKKLGVSDQWIKVDFYGEEGYIFGELLKPVSAE